MFGMIFLQDQQRRGIELANICILGQPFLCAGLRQSGVFLGQRSKNAGRKLKRQGVTKLVLPEGFPFRQELQKQGVEPISTLGLRREIAADWTYAVLVQAGLSAATATVAVTAEQANSDVVRTVTELAMRHRYLLLCLPRGGEELARRLRREYGVSLRLQPSAEELRAAAVVVAFAPPKAEHPLVLRLYDEHQPMPHLLLPPEQEPSLPAGVDRGQLIAALRQGGGIKRGQLHIANIQGR